MMDIDKLYRMLATARSRNDRATEILVRARIVEAWKASVRGRFPIGIAESELRLMDGNR
jgi:hypothetical protein